MDCSIKRLRHLIFFTSALQAISLLLKVMGPQSLFYLPRKCAKSQKTTKPSLRPVTQIELLSIPVYLIKKYGVAVS